MYGQSWQEADVYAYRMLDQLIGSAITWVSRLHLPEVCRYTGGRANALRVYRERFSLPA